MITKRHVTCEQFQESYAGSARAEGSRAFVTLHVAID